MKNMIIAHNGSIQNIPNIPDDVKAVYKNVWEISQKKILDLAADRGAFICQSQSLNVHLSAPTLGQLTSMHFYGWKKGLKTGMYYLRTRPAAQATQFTVDQKLLKDVKQQQTAKTPVVIPTPRTVPVITPALSSVPSIASSSVLSSAASSPAPQTPPATLSESDLIVQQFMEEQAKLQVVEGTGEQDEYAAALARQKAREYAEAKLMCSLENKEACLMCSG